MRPLWLVALVACSSSSESAVADAAVNQIDAAASGSPDAAAAGATAYRITSLAIVDPRLYDDSSGNCTNITDSYINVAVNVQVGAGTIDALIVFEPLDTTPGSSRTAELIFGDCDDTHLNCFATSSSTHATLTAMSRGSGTCLTPVPGTLANDPAPTIPVPTAPCTSDTSSSASLDLAGLRLNLTDFHLAAQFGGGTVPSELQKGLLYGFLTKAEAAGAQVPGFGHSLDHFLRGGGSCADGAVSDTDQFNSGWYLYLTFTATKVSFVDQR